jgi:hypothetical protein
MSQIGEIKRIENGFIFSTYISERFFATADELFDWLLLVLEGRSVNFRNDAYGCVKVFRKPNESFTSPEEEI